MTMMWILRLGDCSGLYWQVQCKHKDLYNKRERQENLNQEGAVMMEAEVQSMQSLALKMTEGGHELTTEKGLWVLFGCSVVPDFLWPHGLQPARFLHPWESQARILECVATSFSRGSSRPRDLIHVSYITGGYFTSELPGKVALEAQRRPLEAGKGKERDSLQDIQQKGSLLTSCFQPCETHF